MIAYMDNSSKLFPYELYSGFTLLKKCNSRSRSARYHWPIYYLIQKPNANACQQSMRYGSEEKKQINGHGDIRCKIKVQ